MEEVDDKLDEFEDCVDEIESILHDARAEYFDSRNSAQVKRWKAKWNEIYSEQLMSEIHSQARTKIGQKETPVYKTRKQKA